MADDRLTYREMFQQFTEDEKDAVKSVWQVGFKLGHEMHNDSIDILRDFGSDELVSLINDAFEFAWKDYRNKGEK